MKTRFEQIRQASRIHGGFFSMWGAALGVRISRFPIPVRFRNRVYRKVYGGKYEALVESDLEKPLSEFRSINELFTRGVRPELRPLAPRAEECFLAPCDGTVQDISRVTSETVLHVKDIPYQLSSLAPGINTDPFRDGHYAILFLSPRDCHRVFSPQAATLNSLSHVPGYRLLVHPPFQRTEFPVFTLNERVVMELSTSAGRCLVIMVAGWGVGHITHPFHTGLVPHNRRLTRTELKPGRQLLQAEWLATFELGSTVILITESRHPSGTEFTATSAVGQPIRYGQTLFSPQHLIRPESDGEEHGP